MRHLWFALIFLSPVVAWAGNPTTAPWIWVDAPREVKTAWFRREVKASEPSTGYIRVAADRRFVLWVNGRRLGEGDASKFHRFDLNGVAERGTNVVAVEVAAGDAKAGLIAEGVVRGQGGREIPFTTDSGWSATTTAPTSDAWRSPGFAGPGWTAARILARHTESPWKSIAFVETELDRFQLAPGFELRRVASHKLTGSIIAMAWGYRGRLLISREGGPILNLIDLNHDGVYDAAVEFSPALKNCQGLCMVGDDLYAVGDGPAGAGVYRLRDANRDGKADSVELVLRPNGGMGEHGPHAVFFGPDGRLYYNHGNHTAVPNKPEANSPIRNWKEGDLLKPRLEDGGGHAVGIKAPGGAIWRFSYDAKKWWLETAGFRNQYRSAFSEAGDLFTFDSDMEWDVGQPWYRPVRVNHCIPGAEFGWRSGAAKWPAYYVDSLPSTFDVGRGSPTGVLVYEHRQFPSRYRGALLLCDWSMGRLLAAKLTPNGASFSGEFETLVSGNPLNVSDIEVAPDGSVLFCTGGRNTEGAIFQLRYVGADARPAAIKAAAGTKPWLAEVLEIPQLSTAWARETIAKRKTEAGAAWAAGVIQAAIHAPRPEHRLRALSVLAQYGPRPTKELLLDAVRDGDPKVRAFACWLLGDFAGIEVAAALRQLLADPDLAVRRRACEAFVRSGLEGPAETLFTLLGGTDVWLRYAARLALERIPVEQWRGLVDAAAPTPRIQGLLGLHHSGNLSPAEGLAEQVKLLETKLTKEDRLATLRLVELSLIQGGKDFSFPERDKLTALLGNAFPVGDDPIDFETARILAHLQAADAAPKLVAELKRAGTTQMEQIHYALCLRYLKAGWTSELRKRLAEWYETTQNWEGGNSIAANLENIFGGSLDIFPAAEIAALVRQYRRLPFTVRALLRQTSPAQVAGFAGAIGALLPELESPAGSSFRDMLLPAIFEALGRSPTAEAQAQLRQLYESQPDRRDMIARALSRHPRVENWPYLVAAIRTGDEITIQVCLKALAALDRNADKADEYRAVILAGLHLGAKGGAAAANVLQRWTGLPHGAGRDWRRGLAFYQNWYRQTYPNAPEAVLPKDDRAKSRYTFNELASFLDQTPAGRQGDAERGKKIFTKANCIKCHRFDKEGENIGPDLTTVRKRFQRREIVESVVYPSLVISDQFKSLAVETRSGIVVNGMPLPQSNPKELVLLLSDATKITIPRSDVERSQTSKVSVMPEGLFKDLSLAEIADLFAYLETSRNAADAVAKPTGGSLGSSAR